MSEVRLQAEQSLLGAILIESTRGTREAINLVAEILDPADFYGFLPNAKIQPLNIRIYQAMLLCPLPPHQINVAEELHQLGILQKGDCAYLAHLVAICPCSLDYLDYAKAVTYHSGKAHKPIYQDVL